MIYTVSIIVHLYITHYIIVHICLHRVRATLVRVPMLCCTPALMKSPDSDVSTAASQETITRLLQPPHRSISELKSRRVWPAGFIYESPSSKAADKLEPQRRAAADELFTLCVRFK